MKKSCKYGKNGAFEHLLFLLNLGCWYHDGGKNMSLSIGVAKCLFDGICVCQDLGL